MPQLEKPMPQGRVNTAKKKTTVIIIKQQKFGWRLELQNQGVGRAVPSLRAPKETPSWLRPAVEASSNHWRSTFPEKSIL